MLRIDEMSNTLVAPQAGGLVTEVNPDRAELVAMLASSWEAFASELGHAARRLPGGHNGHSSAVFSPVVESRRVAPSSFR